MGSIPPCPDRTQRAECFCGNLQPSQLQIIWMASRIFFTGDVLALRTSVSHFGSKLFSGLGNVWGEFEVAWPFRLCNCINCTKTDSVLGTMWSPSYRIKFYKFNTILNNSWQIWRAGNKLSAQNFGSALARAYRITEKSAIVNGTSPFTFNLDL